MEKTALFLLLAFNAYAAMADTVILSVSVNHATPIDVLIEDEAGEKYISEAQAKKLGIQPAGRADMLGNEPYYKLAKFGKISDRGDGTLLLELYDEYLPSRQLSFKTAMPALNPTWKDGAYINYSAQVETLSQPKLFTDTNVAINGWVFNHQYMQAQDSARLSTSLSHENVATRSKIIIGDSYTSSTGWTPAYQFAGLQFKSDDSLQPWNPSTPVINMTGFARAPSQIEYYVNNLMIRREKVDPGAFQLSDLPMMSGGNANVIVKDVMGNSQTLSVPTFYPASLLKKGYQSYSVEAGALRKNIDEYNTPFVGGTYRAGITDTVTLEAHGEWSDNYSSAAAGAVVATQLATAEIGVAENSIGQQLRRVSLYRNLNFDEININLNASRTESDGYMAIDSSTVGNSSQAGIVVSGLLDNTLSFQYNRTEFNDFTYETINASKRLNKNANLMLSMDKDNAGKKSVMMSLFLHLDTQNGSADASISRKTDEKGDIDSASVNFYQPGWYGWRGNAFMSKNEASGNDVLTSRIGYYGRAAEYALYHNDFNGAINQMAQVRGSLVLEDAHIYGTRWIDSGYLVVKAPAGSSVFVNHRNAGVADENGMAIVPFITPHSISSVTAAPADDSLTSTILPHQHKISTYTRASAQVEFKGSEPGFFATFSIDGKPVESGKITISGQDYYIGSRGAYIELPPGDYVARYEDKEFPMNVPQYQALQSIHFAKYGDKTIR